MYIKEKVISNSKVRQDEDAENVGTCKYFAFR